MQVYNWLCFQQIFWAFWNERFSPGSLKVSSPTRPPE